MEFYKFPPKPWQEILPDTSENARDLVNKLIRYQSSDRMSAAAVCDFNLFRQGYADIPEGSETSIL